MRARKVIDIPTVHPFAGRTSCNRGRPDIARQYVAHLKHRRTGTVAVALARNSFSHAGPKERYVVEAIDANSSLHTRLALCWLVYKMLRQSTFRLDHAP